MATLVNELHHEDGPNIKQIVKVPPSGKRIH